MAGVLSVRKTRALFLALISVWVTVIPVQAHNDVSFAILSFVTSDLSRFQTNGNVGVGGDGMMMIRDIKGQPPSTARITFRTPVKFYNAAAGTAASFKTSFVFTISNSSSMFAAEGFAFFIAQTLEGSPLGSEGGGLGLFNFSRETGSPVDGTSKLVAIEIDTFQRNGNAWFDQPYAPHVGLDLNSLNSTAVSPPSPFLTTSINNGSNIGMWIEYSAENQEISISVSASKDSPTKEDAQLILTYPNFDLSAWIDENSYVGFSASTGEYGETVLITQWNFSTSFLPGPTVAKGVKAKIGVGVGLPVLALLLLFLCLRWRRKKRPSRRSGAGWRQGTGRIWALPDKGFGPGPMGYNSLKKATKGFSTILGEGGFGGVYVGVLVDGSEVAVKRIKKYTQDGEKQFLTEVTTIGKLSHKNLVPLKGWCYEHDQLLIVYEYMPNGSLADHLYPHPNAPDPDPVGLNWPTRVSIIRGVADALGYLHGGFKQLVVHRDIKPSNVMLDANFVPKLGDFGLAVAIEQDKDFQTVTGAAGTLGYLAPECLRNLKVGPDSDVYSFGVMVLEIVCGRKPVDWSKPQNETILVTWVWNLYIAEENLIGAVCPSLKADCKEEDADMLLRLALMCTVPNPSNRPSMRTITQLLERSLKMPTLPREIPPQFAESPKTSSARSYWDTINSFNKRKGPLSGLQAATLAAFSRSKGFRSGSQASMAGAMEAGLSAR